MLAARLRRSGNSLLLGAAVLQEFPGCWWSVAQRVAASVRSDLVDAGEAAVAASVLGCVALRATGGRLWWVPRTAPRRETEIHLKQTSKRSATVCCPHSVGVVRCVAVVGCCSFVAMLTWLVYLVLRVCGRCAASFVFRSLAPSDYRYVGAFGRGGRSGSLPAGENYVTAAEV